MFRMHYIAYRMAALVARVVIHIIWYSTIMRFDAGRPMHVRLCRETSA